MEPLRNHAEVSVGECGVYVPSPTGARGPIDSYVDVTGDEVCAVDRRSPIRIK